jgi:hypothetical protein
LLLELQWLDARSLFDHIDPGHRSSRQTKPKYVGFLTSLLRHFDRRHPITPDSQETDENSVRWLACRKTHGFSGDCQGVTYWSFDGGPEKGLRFRDNTELTLRLGHITFGPKNAT